MDLDIQSVSFDTVPDISVSAESIIDSINITPQNIKPEQLFVQESQYGDLKKAIMSSVVVSVNPTPANPISVVKQNGIYYADVSIMNMMTFDKGARSFTVWLSTLKESDTVVFTFKDTGFEYLEFYTPVLIALMNTPATTHCVLDHMVMMIETCFAFACDKIIVSPTTMVILKNPCPLNSQDISRREIAANHIFTVIMERAVNLGFLPQGTLDTIMENTLPVVIKPAVFLNLASDNVVKLK